MNSPKNKLSFPNKLHLIHAHTVLILSAFTYLIFLCYVFQNSGDGGGQPTLRGYGKIIAAISFLAVLILLGFQLLLYRFIRRRNSIMVLALFIPLPLFLLVPLGIAALNIPDPIMPDFYWRIILGNLIAADFFCYFAIRSRYPIAIGSALIHLAAISLFSFYCLNISGQAVQRERRAIEKSYANTIAPIDENAPRWNADGSSASVNRYMSNPPHKPDSEILYYPNDWVMSRRYIYDSMGAIYERELLFTEYGYQYASRIENQTTKESTVIEYFKDAKMMAKYECHYDINKTTYKRQIIYRKDGQVRQHTLLNLKTHRQIKINKQFTSGKELNQVR